MKIEVLCDLHSQLVLRSGGSLMKYIKRSRAKKTTQGGPTPASLSRRNFLQMGLGALSAVAVLETGIAGFMFLRSRSLEGDFGGTIKAGEVD